MSDTLNRKLAELLEPEPEFSAVWYGPGEGEIWTVSIDELWLRDYEDEVEGCPLPVGVKPRDFEHDMNAAAALFEAALPRIAEKFGVTREEVHIDTRPRRDGTWYSSFPWQLTHVGRTGKTIPESWRNAIAAALGASDG